MPCRDWDGWTEADSRESRLRDTHTEEMKKLQAGNDKLAAMLCSVMTLIDSRLNAVARLVPKDVQRWWVAHKQQDAAQARRELAKKQEEEHRKNENERRRQLILRATKKLTAEELQALRDSAK